MQCKMQKCEKYLLIEYPNQSDSKVSYLAITYTIL